MDCSCVAYGGGDDYGPECMTQKERKARKTHVCIECRGAIVPGEKYEYTSGIWDGDPSSFKTCLACRELRTWLVEEAMFGELFEALGESFGYGEILPSKCTDPLTDRARDKLCDWIESQWEEL